MSKEFIGYCEAHGIQRQLTAPYTPQQNGVTDHKNKTVVDMARSMLKEKNVSTVLWAEAVVTTVYILNRSSTSAVKGPTPYEALKGSKRLVYLFRVFGCLGYVLNHSQFQRKFDSRVRKCVFIGYNVESKAYKLFDPVTGKLVISRNVTFCEDAAWNWSENANSTHRSILEDDEEHSEDSHAENSHSTNIQPLNSEDPSLNIDQDTPMRYKSLTELYDTCSFALSVTDPIIFDEATKCDE